MKDVNTRSETSQINHPLWPREEINLILAWTTKSVNENTGKSKTVSNMVFRVFLQF